jgi:hypothetical protein
VDLLGVKSGFELLARMNLGPDHGCTFEIAPLDLSSDLESAVAKHLGKTHAGEPLAGVRFKLGEVQGDGRKTLRKTLTKWFFETEYSPILKEVDQLTEVLEWFLSQLAFDKLYSVTMIEYPGFYECAWDDLVLKRGNKAWFLHLGVSD